jgi:hypothetical protein
MAIQNLPSIIVRLYTEDYGEYGAACCPHCGAKGRYIHTFLCDDGKLHSAMAGCIKLYPHKITTMSKMAEIALKKQKELNDHNKKTGNNQKLTSWFQATIDTLENLKNGKTTISEANTIICDQYNKRDWWLRKNGYKK